MNGKKGTQRRCPPIPPLESLFRDNHYSLLAMPRDTLGFAAERALDDLGELGPCGAFPQKATDHKALGWRTELAADAGPPIRATMLRALLEHTRARRRRVRRHKCPVFIRTAYPGE
jgi:hypothetical protein